MGSGDDANSSIRLRVAATASKALSEIFTVASCRAMSITSLIVIPVVLMTTVVLLKLFMDSLFDCG
ncbi:unannotated protein [freshwater metagenome]|uniref:Unannotated protein n=1 Tax=freshwater metagenome TaxID=449393 RepID=A0A6J5ZT52_9ZZZZ